MHQAYEQPDLDNADDQHDRHIFAFGPMDAGGEGLRRKQGQRADQETHEAEPHWVDVTERDFQNRPGQAPQNNGRHEKDDGDEAG